MSEDTTALVVATEAAPPASLLAGSTYTDRVQHATALAQALAPIIDSRQLYVWIEVKTRRGVEKRRHVLYEGWTTLGALAGVFPVTVWSRPTANGWEARVEARTLDGQVIGAAEAEVTRDELHWRDRRDFELRSMAQTRAGSKALRMPLGFILVLAGYEATPAEEMLAATAEAAEDGEAPAEEEPEPEPVGTPPLCTDCSAQMVWRTGEKEGRRWAAWMCPARRKGDDGHAPVWVALK